MTLTQLHSRSKESLGVLNMSSIIGSILGGSSLSALLLGAFDFNTQGTAMAVVLSLLGGCVITLFASLVDSKSSNINS